MLIVLRVSKERDRASPLRTRRCGRVLLAGVLLSALIGTCQTAFLVCHFPIKHQSALNQQHLCFLRKPIHHLHHLNSRCKVKSLIFCSNACLHPPTSFLAKTITQGRPALSAKRILGKTFKVPLALTGWPMYPHCH
jgi:hypothetical protein